MTPVPGRTNINPWDFVSTVAVDSPQEICRAFVRGICVSVDGRKMTVEDARKRRHTCHVHGAQMIPDAALAERELRFAQAWRRSCLQ